MSFLEPKVEIIDKDHSIAIVKTEYTSEQIDVAWHTHQEIEIIYVKEGYGTRIIGESVSMFKPGTLMLIGSGVPHLIKSDPKSEINTQIVIQFSEKLISKDLLFFNEFSAISQLNENAFHGLEFPKKFSSKISQQLSDFINIPKHKSIVAMYDLLTELAEEKSAKKLSTLPYKKESGEQSRIGKVFNYVLSNYMEYVSVDEAAEIINLSKPAFCNYFKKKVNKRFSEFVTELRINKACVLLKETEMNVSEVSDSVGFSNISYFNRSFLKQKGLTPLQFRNKS